MLGLDWIAIVMRDDVGGGGGDDGSSAAREGNGVLL